jgi:hypothetical protein
MLKGIIDKGTHMSLIRLNSGKFLVLDTINLTPAVKQEFDTLTENGAKIEAIIATHPFHTMSFHAFHALYPNPKYYGTPRHLRAIAEIPWAGSVEDRVVQKLWEPEVEMRIPAGSEFNNPLPPDSNHFSNVFVFHRKSRSVHNDDTVMFCTHPVIADTVIPSTDTDIPQTDTDVPSADTDIPPTDTDLPPTDTDFLLSLAGFKDGSMAFHPSIMHAGLLPTAEAPVQFREWVEGILRDWDFDNLLSAHNGNKIGGAKEQLRLTLQNAEKVFTKHVAKYKSFRLREVERPSQASSIEP